ncbi:hypothetical protein ACFFGV_19675 [Pontibacillus salicampi]|uniref:Uncharacterized protein n=1 Tax=Pontibacillus salicampi TaxID=1449801 RepID=A0ABV6LTS2_9BACI
MTAEQIIQHMKSLEPGEEMSYNLGGHILTVRRVRPEEATLIVNCIKET